MKYIRTIVCPVLLTVVLLLAVRGLLVNHVRMPADAAVEGFAPRQHLLVSLTYYGLRLPGETLWAIIAGVIACRPRAIPYFSICLGKRGSRVPACRLWAFVAHCPAIRCGLIPPPKRYCPPELRQGRNL